MRSGTITESNRYGNRVLLMPKETNFSNIPHQPETESAHPIAGTDTIPNCPSLLPNLLQHYPEVAVDTFRIVRGLSISYILLMTIADDHLRPSGLSWSKLFILLLLRAAHDEGNDGLAPSTLSSYLTVTRNTVSTLLGGLERQGYITRDLDVEDKRRFIMRLTPAGYNAIEASAVPLFKHLQDAMGRLETTQSDALLAGLTQIQCLLQQSRSACANRDG